MSEPIVIEPYTGQGGCDYAYGCPDKAKWVEPHTGARFCGPCRVQAELAGVVVPAGVKLKAKYEAKAKAETGPRKVVPLPVPAGTCGCGCKTPVKGVFAPGHDSRLKAARRKKHLDPYTGEED